MALTDQLVLLGGLLLVLSVLATVPAHRSGVPVLLLFLVIGIVAGTQASLDAGLDQLPTAHLLATAALAVILFDGGLHTPLASFRSGLAPGLVLATLGVAITAGVTAAVLVALFPLGWAMALLLAAIISSTDAAAVFHLLRSSGLALHLRVRNILEIESGINDPMAVFLTLTMVEWIRTDAGLGAAELAASFAWQMGGGAALGLAGGLGLTALVNRVRLAESLYPLLALAGGLLIYGAAAVAGSSGFLAAYVGGLTLGNRARVARRGIQRFHDGVAWLCQMGLFLMLGLLVRPAELLDVASLALGAAAAVTLLARPLAVLGSLAPFRVPWRQGAFVAWVGLRGAVPIVLGLFPLMAGIPGALEIFHAAFFLVLFSLLLQGATVAPLARRLGLELPRTLPQARRVDVDAPPDHELVICELPPGCPALNETVERLVPPERVELLAVWRAGRALAPTPGRALRPHDLLYLLVPTDDARAQERFEHWLNDMGTIHPSAEAQYFGEFTVDAEAPLASFLAVYRPAAEPPARPDETLAEHLQRRLHGQAEEGDRVRLGDVVLVVREMDGRRVTKVGVKLPRPGSG